MLLIISWYSYTYDDIYIGDYKIESKSEIKGIIDKFKRYRFKQEIGTEYSEDVFNENFYITYKLI